MIIIINNYFILFNIEKSLLLYFDDDLKLKLNINYKII